MLLITFLPRFVACEGDYSHNKGSTMYEQNIHFYNLLLLIVSAVLMWIKLLVVCTLYRIFLALSRKVQWLACHTRQWYHTGFMRLSLRVCVCLCMCMPVMTCERRSASWCDVTCLLLPVMSSASVNSTWMPATTLTALSTLFLFSRSPSISHIILLYRTFLADHTMRSQQQEGV